jgi:hypothetical protein
MDDHHLVLEGVTLHAPHHEHLIIAELHEIICFKKCYIPCASSSHLIIALLPFLPLEALVYCRGKVTTIQNFSEILSANFGR